MGNRLCSKNLDPLHGYRLNEFVVHHFHIINTLGLSVWLWEVAFPLNQMFLERGL